jgi:hypothetical protein
VSAYGADGWQTGEWVVSQALIDQVRKIADDAGRAGGAPPPM